MTCSARCTPLTEKARSKHNVKILGVYHTLDFFALSAAVFRNKSNESQASRSMLGTAQKFHAHQFLYCSDNIQQDLAINTCGNVRTSLVDPKLRLY